MMFTRASTFALLAALPLLAAATTTPATPASQCNTGGLQCCQSTQESSSPTPALNSLFGLLGIVVGSLTGQVGCNNLFAGHPGWPCWELVNGLVALGCSPVNAHL
ncbi:hypothetical protein BD779DRAFT_1466668 [Infundibulicybe gibba]|nr:hypothetical protein BD779DRAFT_1466668 [Infundibulicybe gibba]